MARGLADLNPAARRWFESAFEAPTLAQSKAWPPIRAGKSTLLLAPTGSGKTLAAFLAAIDRLMFSPEPDKKARCRVLYVSPLKALGVDVERNLRAPIAGIRAVAERDGIPHRVPSVGVRTGDTSSSERARLARTPADILITTPESLYLLLTSNARETLGSIDTVIVDEIHSVVASKRGAHLFVSLERLEALREGKAPLQRIGLSATQRPLEEVARLLGGGEVNAAGFWRPRDVEIADAGRRRPLELTVEVPVEDMARLGQEDDETASDPAAQSPKRRSIWPSIHPRLVELIRAHRSTMVFVNSRRLAERMAAALNELAKEDLALAHHGSIARDTRSDIEDRLKRGVLPAIIATSSLELGIDMGAVDLVVQIEAPPSVASGLQRIGRAGHHVGGTSRGVLFPKFRGDLLACAAATRNMMEGKVEETFHPRNPLDVLAQQIVATVAMDPIHADALYALVRRAAPFSDLPRSAYEGVLDMLSGRYPSDELSDLRPRITWDRTSGLLEGRQGARRIAVVSGGTIPDRGLYGVFLRPDDSGKSRRVGELDEEMVFESLPGDVFLLGASSWRIDEITHDRVIVTPAPGEPGKMPFWHGDRPGRPLELGRAIGELSRKLARMPKDEATELLKSEHGLDPRAASNLWGYLAEQIEAVGEVPSDRTVVFERFLDEVGDWRVCILSPFGARVHAPWAIAVAERLREEVSPEVDLMWSDDGLVFRLPEADAPPDPARFFPSPDEVEERVVRQLADTSLFAARFRENAGRALLLPKRTPGKRTPLWAQRRRARDLLAVAAKFRDFPIVLETYRECLKDVFDLPGLIDLLRQIEARKIRVATAQTKTPSPFSASLLFSYVASFIYEGDAPLAERRAQALSIDTAQLRELLGEAELRDLLDADAIELLEQRLQRLDPERRVRHADALHDLFLAIGELRRDEVAARVEPSVDADALIETLRTARRIIEVNIAGEERYAAAEDASRLRDALGVVPPAGLPSAFLESVADPLGDLVSRYARTHGPFRVEAIADRLGLGVAPVRTALERLLGQDRVAEGELLPGGRGREWCDAGVLRTIKRQSLAKLRKQVEPVDGAALGRFLPDWHGVRAPRSGLDALLSAVEQLQGAPVVASSLETELLPARIKGYRPSDLDELCAAGELMWRGLGPIGIGDGRVALYLTDQYPLLAPPPDGIEDELPARVRALLAARGALFWADLASLTGAFPADLATALWALVWAGEVTNDTLVPLRSFLAGPGKSARANHPARGRAFRSRRIGPPGTEGRWSLLPMVGPARVDAPDRGEPARVDRSVAGGPVDDPAKGAPVDRGVAGGPVDDLARARPAPLDRSREVAAGPDDWTRAGPTETARRTALVRQLLSRHGVLTREAVHAENVAGGFSAVYPVLKAMEEAGKIRRGYFVSGLGATQFALPGADDRLRALREREDEPATLVLAATDPANPYGAALPWPEREGARPQRAAGAQVILHDGELAAWIGRTEKTLLTFLPDQEPELSARARAVASALAALAERGQRRAILVTRIDGEAPEHSALAKYLAEAGFSPSSRGFLKRRGTR